MRKLLYTILAVSIIFLVCKKEEPTSIVNDNSTKKTIASVMTGKWQNNYHLFLYISKKLIGNY